MFRQWIEKLTAQPAAAGDERDAIEQVTTQLLVEVARADHNIEAAELARIRQALQSASSLGASEIDALVDQALVAADATVSLHAHVQLINDQGDKALKVHLVEQMWRVALADGRVDEYEEYTIRKLADLLHLKHRDFMQAKLRVFEGADQT